MKVAVELLVSSSSCFADDAAEHSITDPKGRFKISLKNNPDAGPFAKRSLVVVVVFEIDEISAARDKALDYFAEVQNALTFATGTVFRDVIATKAFDWEPGKVQREAQYFATPESAISHPFLDSELIKSTERVMAMHSDDICQTIMRWYRLGTRSDIPEQQFSYFWFAAEVAAESLKAAGKIAPKCPVCNSDLFCQTCEKIPQRRRFTSEAIDDLIHSVAPRDANRVELSNTLFKIRNTLQHGRRIDTIIDTLPCTQEQAVNVMARIAWRALTKLADQEADPTPGEALTFIELDDVQNKTMTLTASIVTQLMSADHDNPAMENAPAINLSMVINGKNYTFDGVLIEP